MRYKLSEDIVLAGKLPEGSTVTVKVLNMVDDTLIALDTAVCPESSYIAGLYRWSTSSITTALTGYVSCYYEMTDGTNTISGKFVYGGYIDTQATNQDTLQASINEVPTAVENADTLCSKVV